MSSSPILVILRGLPGTGKSTLARELALAEGFVLVRVDTIEQALLDGGVVKGDMGPGGYVVGFALATENLKLGLSVIADSVNPLAVTRGGWQQMAAEAGVPHLDVEIVCSDRAEHRRRIETREIDIPGLGRVRWDEVEALGYEPGEADLRIDTAGQRIEDCLTVLKAAMRRVRDGAL